jgi:MFS transporter, PAT family, beta-lactamase induction signal transducer AmpG
LIGPGEEHSGAVNPPCLFGLLAIPYGFSNAVGTILMPFLLRRQGVPVDRIAGIVALALLPTVWSFLYAPVVDLGLRRKTWLLMASATVAVCSFGAVSMLPVSLTLLTVLLFAATAVSGLISTACGALMTALRTDLRGQAGGWYNAGNLGGGAVGGGLVIWLADRLSLAGLGASVAAIMFLPMLTALLIQESARARVPFIPQMTHMIRDMWEVLKSPRTLTGLIFFLSPVGSAAVSNLISGVGPDYHSPDSEVIWVMGIAGGLLCALGSLIGGYVCSRMNRMVAYTLAGGLCSIFAIYLGFAPRTAFTYGAGYTGYALAAGFAYAVFTALVLDVVGARKHAAGTAYALLVASGNLPISLMTWLDGAGYQKWGARGLMGVDALANGGGGLLLLVVAYYSRRFWRE